MHVGRRVFLKSAAGSIGLLDLSSACSTVIDNISARQNTSAISDSKREKVQRRIILNDDGDDAWSASSSTPQGFLAARLNHTLETQIDTIFYCTTQSFNYFTHNTKIGEVFVSRDPPFQNNGTQKLIEQGTDCLSLAVEFAHRHRKEIFWSLRMNDIHDSFTPLFLPRWKREHPDCVMGTPDTSGQLGSVRQYWSYVDFEMSRVRERCLELVEEVARNYDVDGIELDCMRSPVFFRSTFDQKHATQHQTSLLTDLIGRTRASANDAGKRRGRALLLAARVPLTVKLCSFVGIDVKTWLRERLVDVLVIGGGYVPFSMPVNELIELGHKSGVPVYPCISKSGMIRRPPYGNGEALPVEAWRAAAMRLHSAGADGIYVFNLFPDDENPRESEFFREVTSEIGDPRSLARKEKMYSLDSAGHMRSSGSVAHAEPWQRCLPRELKTMYNIVKVDVAEDVSSGISVTLQVELLSPYICDEWSCRINNHVLGAGRHVSGTAGNGFGWFEFYIKPNMIKRGSNVFETYVIQRNPRAKGPLVLNALELWIKYPNR